MDTGPFYLAPLAARMVERAQVTAGLDGRVWVLIPQEDLFDFIRAADRVAVARVIRG